MTRIVYRQSSNFRYLLGIIWNPLLKNVLSVPFQGKSSKANYSLNSNLADDNMKILTKKYKATVSTRLTTAHNLHVILSLCINNFMW